MNWLIAGGIIAGLFVLWFGVGTLVLMWAWGMVMVPIFNLPALEFWQAVALMVILGFAGPGIRRGR